MSELYRIEWNHPNIGRVSEDLCPTHESQVLQALNTLDIGCSGGLSPADAVVCLRCANEGIQPRVWLRVRADQR